MREILEQSAMTAPAPRLSRSWPVRTSAVILLLQALGLATISLSSGAWRGWPLVLPGMVLAEEMAVVILISGLLLVVAVLAILAAIGLLVWFRLGWLLAMMTQDVILLVCLYLYLEHRPGFIYPVMLSCVVLVLYLNSYEVRLTFNGRSTARRAESDDDA
jgi:hypothetical protein